MTKLLSKEIIKKFDWKKIWYFRFKRLDKETMLITNDFGAYVYLSNHEFQDFIKWWDNLPADKFKELQNKKFFKDTQYYEDDYKFEYWMKNSFLAFWPVLHIMIVTLRCDHKCKYCHAAAAPLTAKKYDMSLETARRAVDTMFYSTATGITIEFQGWEPLANWEVIKFTVEYATKKSKATWKNVNFCLVTNMTLMDDEKLDFIINNQINISTSLDWDEKTHNYNRISEKWETYKNTVKWIEKINKIYKEDKRVIWVLWYEKKIGALMTVTKKTLGRRKECIDSYVDKWLDGIFIRPLNPYGFAASDLEELGYTEDEFLDYYRKSLDYIIEINKKWTMLREIFSYIFLSKIMTPKDPNFLEDRSPCWAWIWQVAYNYDGNLYTCDEWRMLSRMWVEDFKIWELSDDPKSTYIDMMTSDATNILVEASTLDWLPWYEDSVYKPYMWTCPIYNYKVRNSVYPNFSIDMKKKIEYWVIDYLFQKLKDDEVKSIFKKWIKIRGADEVGDCECN